MEYFWTYERNGVIEDQEFKTKAECILFANEEYDAECLDRGIDDGETWTEDYHLIYFRYNKEGSRVIDEREQATLECSAFYGTIEDLY